jgi:hypothetical protein
LQGLRPLFLYFSIDVEKTSILNEIITLKNIYMAQLIYPEGLIKTVLPDHKRFTLEEMYKLLECQLIAIHALYDGRSMVVDEEFACYYGWEENINIQATILYKKGRATYNEKQQFLDEQRKQGFEIIRMMEDNPSDSIGGKALICNIGELY